MTDIALRQDIAADLGTARPRPATAGSSRAVVPGLELDLVTSLPGLEAIEADWRALFATAGGPGQTFQAFDWCWHWCRHYATGASAAEIAIVTGRIAGRLVLVLPLAVQRSAGLRQLVWLGEPVSQYGDALAAAEASDADSLLAAWHYALAATRADVATLRKVRADAIVAPLLARLGSTVTATEEAPYLDLSADRTYAGWEERRQPRARKNRKRQARRLADPGPLRFLCHSGTAEAGHLARHAAELKRQTLDVKGAISPTLADPRFAAFFADVSAGNGRPAATSVRVLETGGTAAALKVLVEQNTTTCLHIAVFDPAFEKHGAGAVLLENVIADAIAEGRQRLDLLAPRHDYKMDFADGVVLVHDHALALSARGWLFTQGFLRLRRRLKALVEALPAPVRRAVARLAG